MKPEEIATIRLKLGLTQEQFAHIVGCTYATINRLENGHHKPSPLIIDKIRRISEEADASASMSKL
jgi:putative transcriptional regulator